MVAWVALALGCIRPEPPANNSGQNNASAAPSADEDDSQPPKQQPQEKSPITVITIDSYPGGDNPGSFSIAGTDIKKVELPKLLEALTKRNLENPDETYEIYAEYKADVESTDQLADAIRKTRIKLKHYWVPVSDVDINAKPGKYGLGHIDLLNLPNNPDIGSSGRE